MMEISKVNEFESFQTNNKTALSPMLMHEVCREFGGRARKLLCFPLARAWSVPFRPPHHHAVLLKQELLVDRT